MVLYPCCHVLRGPFGRVQGGQGALQGMGGGHPVFPGPMIVAALGVRAFEIFQCQGIYKMGRQFGEPRMVLVDDEAALVPGPRMHAPLGALEVDDVLGIENVFAEFRHFFLSGRGRVRAEEEIPGLERPLRAARHRGVLASGAGLRSTLLHPTLHRTSLFAPHLALHLIFLHLILQCNPPFCNRLLFFVFCR